METDENYSTTYDSVSFTCTCPYFNENNECNHILSLVFFNNYSPEICKEANQEFSKKSGIGHMDIFGDYSAYYKEGGYTTNLSRVRLDSFTSIVKGYNNYVVTYKKGTWGCDCRYFRYHHLCAHSIALERWWGMLGLSLESPKFTENPVYATFTTETKIRNFIDSHLQSTVGKNYWESSIPYHIREGLENRIRVHISHHPYDKWDDYPAGRKRLDFCNVSDYQTIIFKNWKHFKKIFIKQKVMEQHFSNFRIFRNTVMHNRELNDIDRQMGEAAIKWIQKVIDSYTY